MGQIQITVSELESKKAQLLNLHLAAMDEVEQTDTVVQNLKAEWEGEAADAFQASYQEKRMRLLQALEALKGIINSIDRVIQTYSETEAANIRLASSGSGACYTSTKCGFDSSPTYATYDSVDAAYTSNKITW